MPTREENKARLEAILKWPERSKEIAKDDNHDDPHEWMNEILDANDEAFIDAIEALNAQDVAASVVWKRIFDYKDHMGIGQNVIAMMADSNEQSAATDAQKDAYFDNVDVQKIMLALMAGSLGVARRKIAALDITGLSATEADRAALLAELDKYL